MTLIQSSLVWLSNLLSSDLPSSAFFASIAFRILSRCSSLPRVLENRVALLESGYSRVTLLFFRALDCDIKTYDNPTKNANLAKKFASSVRKKGMNSILICVHVRLSSTLDYFGSFLVMNLFYSSGGPRQLTFFCRFFALS